jgi:hypothetical protein
MLHFELGEKPKENVQNVKNLLLLDGAFVGHM